MRELLTARIIRQERDYLTALTADREYLCSVAGRFRQNSEDSISFPVIGDQVEILPQNDRQASIERILPRRNTIRRKKAGNPTDPQALAANIDLAILVLALDGGRNFNVRRIERFLALMSVSQIPCLLALNKTDLCDEPEPFLAECRQAFPHLPILLTSAKTGLGLDTLRAAMKPDNTIILLGPSGVGKSAMLNALAGQEYQREMATREKDKRGRHSTTNRRMFRLPGGAWLIDTPGIREIGLWDDLQGGQAFPEIEALAPQCRFRDCLHEQEPGCAVQKAVEDGALDDAHYRHYLALQKERHSLNHSREESARIREKRSWKKIKYSGPLSDPS